MMMWEKVKITMAGLVLVVAVGASATATALARRQEQDRSAKLQKAEQDVPAVAAVVAGPTGPDPRWMRTLSNGATIEVLGVSPHPSGPNTWWKPDGTPLAQAPCDRSRNMIGAGGDRVIRAIVVRVAHLPPGAEQNWWINEANGGSHGHAELGGKPVPALSEVISTFPRTTRICTVRFEVASGDWKTAQT
jgi:hypothetical protein